MTRDIDLVRRALRAYVEKRRGGDPEEPSYRAMMAALGVNRDGGGQGPVVGMAGPEKKSDSA